MFTGSVLSLKRRCPVQGLGDFVVDGSPCDVAYNGVRGATVNTFLDADMFACIIAARPHVVCLCLGGNDFPASTPVMIALDIFRLARIQCPTPMYNDY